MSRDTGQFAGVINLTNVIMEAFRSGYLGYYAFAGQERRGYMREGLRAVVVHAFRSLKLHRLEGQYPAGQSRFTGAGTGLRVRTGRLLTSLFEDRGSVGATMSAGRFWLPRFHEQSRCIAADRGAVVDVERLHDIRLVRPSEGTEQPAVVHRGARQLGNCAVRIPAAGSCEPHRLYQFSVGQLKILQEVITLSVFLPFSVFFMRQPLRLDYLWAALCILGAVYFMFRGASVGH